MTTDNAVIDTPRLAARAENDNGVADWRNDSVCRQHPTRWWFAGGQHETVLAKAICTGCSVQAECLEFALSRPEILGIWAATTPNERAVIRRQRRSPRESGDETTTSEVGTSEVEVGRVVEVRLDLDLVTEPASEPAREPVREPERKPLRRARPGASVDRGELLTPAEAARKLGVTPNTVTRWSRAGKIPAIQTMGGHRRFRRSEIERLLREASLATATRP